MFRKRFVVALLFTVALILVAGGILEMYLADRVYFGVRVRGVGLGGKRLDAAVAALHEGIPALDQPTVILRAPDRVWNVRPADLGVALMSEETALSALRVGREEGVFTHLELALSGYDVAPILSYDEAVARIYLEYLAETMYQAPVDASLAMNGITPEVTAARAGVSLDVPASLAAIRESVVGELGPVEVDLVVREIVPQIVESESARAQAEALVSQQFVLLLPNPREGDPGPWMLTPQDMAGMLTSYAIQDRLQVTLDSATLRSYLEVIAPSLRIEPVNARFHFDDATGDLEPIAPSSEGRELDVEASQSGILAAVEAGQHTAPLAVRAVPPLYPDTATAEELGIRELVAEGDSYFIGSPSGRDHNIKLAASQFDGLVIPPGDTFSFNHYLGEISEETGYEESYITAGEQLGVEVGGGICQVSTTVFRAALWGGFQIVERSYHYQRVGYYELRGYGPGFDATVYTPLVDFKFVNDGPAPLLIEVEVDEDEHWLAFRFYSTADGRRVEVMGPEVTDETEPGPAIYELDEDLEPNEVIEWQTAQGGLSATVERWVYDAAGGLLHHNVFNSRYAPRRAAYHYGPGYVPPQD